jgi:hypothetical protein
MDQDAVTKLVNQVVGPVVADYVKEVRQLRTELNHVKRQLLWLRNEARIRQNKERVRETESDE